MNLGSLLMGLGSLYAGARALRDAFDGDSDLADAEVPASGSDDSISVAVHSVRTIDQRVSYIVRMIQKGRWHPEVRKRALQIVSRKCGNRWCVPEKNWDAEAKAVFDYTRANVRYARDSYGRDQFQHPRRTLQWGGGDCDDYTILLGSLLQSIGYPVKCRVIQTDGHKDYNHIYLVVGLPPQAPSRWVALDGSMDRPAGWEAPARMIKKKRDFPVR